MRKMSEIGFLRNLGFDVEEEDGLTWKEGGGLNFSTREELRGQYPPSMIHSTAKMQEKEFAGDQVRMWLRLCRCCLLHQNLLWARREDSSGHFEI